MSLVVKKVRIETDADAIKRGGHLTTWDGEENMTRIEIVERKAAE